MPKRINKWLYEIVLQSYYPGAGWSDECGCSDWAEARTHRKEYRENCPGLPIRIINRREPNPEYQAA